MGTSLAEREGQQVKLPSSGTERVMKERLKKEATAYAKLDNIRKNIQFTSKTKIKISKSSVPSMLFGWAGAKPRQPHSNRREEARCTLT